jgi:quercetin dioxygenase-like cupin family protein
MEFIPAGSIATLTNSGVRSEQLLSPENSRSVRVTITRVTVPPACSNPRHIHDTSEQTWVALSGSGTLLLAGGQEHAFSEGDVVRFSEGDIHGVINRGSEPLVYISVTCPPINFRNAYAKGWNNDANVKNGAG